MRFVDLDEGAAHRAIDLLRRSAAGCRTVVAWLDATSRSTDVNWRGGAAVAHDVRIDEIVTGLAQLGDALDLLGDETRTALWRAHQIEHRRSIAAAAST